MKPILTTLATLQITTITLYALGIIQWHWAIIALPVWLFLLFMCAVLMLINAINTDELDPQPGDPRYLPYQIRKIRLREKAEAKAKAKAKTETNNSPSPYVTQSPIPNSSL